MNLTTLYWNSCYSQFFNSSFIDCEGNTFFSSEQFMLYHKALFFNDTITSNKILISFNPLKIRDYALNISNYEHSLWKKHRDKVLILGNYYKFNQNYTIKQTLMDSITDFSKTDFNAFWWHKNYDLHNQPYFWHQINILGKCLMKVKELLRTNNSLYINEVEQFIYKGTQWNAQLYR